MGFLKGFAWGCWLLGTSMTAMAVILLRFADYAPEMARQSQYLAGLIVLAAAAGVIALGFAALLTSVRKIN